MEGAIVSVANGAMSSVLSKLAELLHEKYKLAKGVRKDIMFLRSELSVMNDLLYMMADVEELDALNKGWRDRVRELAYDVEDCIDLSVARLDRAGADGSKGGLFGNLAWKLKMARESFRVAGKIQEFKARVVEESKRQKRYKLDGLGSSSGTASNKIDLRMCALWVETEKLVGVDKPRDELIRWLMPEGEEPSQQVRTLSIVGCAGLGKTTLANEVYKKIQGHFECKAFISVSQNPHMKDVLMKICSQVEATVNMVDDVPILVDKIRERLLCKRYIVVVDDIWHSDPWEIIGQALIKTSPGSIIIMTTRLKDVAEACRSSHGGRVYDMRPLDDNDSRRLFFKRIFDSEERCPHELKRASEDILYKCNGIPLAIISISSFLASVDVPQSPDHWNKVKESISSPLPGNKSVETMKSVLSLSYFNLPHHLRTCLLYLSAFPEDCEIQRDHLISRWIAEGFVNAQPGENLYEAGLGYFNVLINRSLIQQWREYNGMVISCRVHDVILNFLVTKSVEENFLTFLDPSGPPPSLHSKVRRLSLHNSYRENLISWINSIKPHVRSLACFVDCKELHPLTEFEVVRVLDLENCDSLRNNHIANIEMLTQLRYLSIRRTRASELPAGIGKVRHLETLDIRSTKVVKLPSTIVLLEKLARLFVGPEVKFPAEGFSKMKGLEDLGFLSVHGQPLSFLKELGQLTNLRILEAAPGSCIVKANYEGSEWGIFTSSLRVLGSHKLHSLYFSTMPGAKTHIPHDSFPAVHSLRTFSICEMSSLPIWMGSLVNLEVLHLGIQQFTPENLRVLGGIPALETLVLEIESSGAGPLTIGRHGFQRLKLFRVYKLKQLLFMPGSMPNLKHLDVALDITKNSYSDLGFRHLANLTKVVLTIYAWRDDAGGEVPEAKIRSLLDAHPNRPTLILSTYFTSDGRRFYLK